MALSIESNLKSSKKMVRLGGRSIEVLSLIALGHSNQQVADHLFISKRTVDFHMTEVFKILNASNRVQAIRTAESLGLIPTVASYDLERKALIEARSSRKP